MKKKIIAIILTLLLILGITVNLSFASVNVSNFMDNVSVFSFEEQKKTDVQLADISKIQNCNVYLMTTDDFFRLRAQQSADPVYELKGMGYGECYDGILPVVNFDSGTYIISIAGNGTGSITDAGQEYLMEKTATDLRQNPSKAFHVYADQGEEFLLQAARGVSYDTGNLPKNFNLIPDISIGIVAGVLITIILAGRQKAALKTVRRQVGAREYMRKKSLKLTIHREEYLYNTVDRTRKNSSSDSSGSSTHKSSSGIASGGLSGKF